MRLKSPENLRDHAKRTRGIRNGCLPQIRTKALNVAMSSESMSINLNLDDEEVIISCNIIN